MRRIFFNLVPALLIASLCYSQTKSTKQTTGKMTSQTNTASASPNQFMEGKDYMQYQRIRLMDNRGFTQPQEAYSVLIPKSWEGKGEIIWVGPGNNGAGTYRHMLAKSKDGKYLFEMLPDVIYSWNPATAGMGFNQDNNFSRTGQPMNAETYLRQILVRELGNAQVVSVEPNQGVIDRMRQNNTKAVNELMQYGAAQVNFDQSALNATIKWNDGSEALVTLGITVIATTVPNVYTGGSNQIYTTSVNQRTVFKYPASDREHAKNLYGIIMSSVRTNPAWNNAVNQFWLQARQQSHTAHVGRIAMMDAETKRIGEQAIKNGQDRQKAMETQARNWEISQNSTYNSTSSTNDRMHTEFIKTIREVENYQDASTGNKYEMTSGYNHAWSRGDGTSFILSNNPNFNPASVFQDQNWKEMRKVR